MMQGDPDDPRGEDPDAPDAVLTREGEALRDWLFPRTVTIIMCRGELVPERLVGNHSAVAVNLDGRYFLLTAGHTVQDMNRYSVALGISATPMTFSPEIVRSNYECHALTTGPDYGYAEVSAATYAVMFRKGKVAILPSRITVLSRDELIAADDWMILCGTPEKLKDISELGVRYKQLSLSTTVAGTGIAPKSPLCGFDGLQHADLWIPRRGPIDTLTPGFPPVDLPPLPGASGCGVWKSNVRPEPSAWLPSKIKLAAIHAAATKWHRIGDEEHRFSREILVGHHLRLIAEDCPELQALIYREWPTLEAWPVLRE